MSAEAPRRRQSPERSRPSVFWPLAAIIVPIIGIFTKIEVSGEENLPTEGAYVLAPNHYSELDPVIVAVAVWRIGRAPRFMAKESLFKVPVLGWALRATGMIPVARTSNASSAKHTIQTAHHLVENGSGVIVYPEGSLTRDPDAWPMRGKTGAVRVAVAGGIPLIPMAHWGVQEIMPRYGKLSLWPLRKRIKVVFGPAVPMPERGEKPTPPSVLVAATDAVMAQVAQMLGEIRGTQPPTERWNPSDHGQRETGRLDS
ncbi:1-acyl-sn-glycerol-3-phosphate acyltransferase [Microbacterium halimionae]|uniref:1-acyl-sn-glycerol-3-phosphate acyltransferase n=1 Tax=Microbacterium halimionae TaxID=1526413 RepID=A0A7W3PMU2_9MICO|nr:lysophospholipid acyltransferase family protein [Microbacterium halimionae]MBA8817436.1 1-acyl-sn-glycerol-3-phosphate acyltransferase [Microbacterium halimionae]NII96070.1 1-acyl-sn-glycerol-3-phosphate acyltransferase [Microbacterium halimionae]